MKVKVIMFLIPSLSLVVPGSGVERMGNDRQHNLYHPVDESYLEPKGDESHCLPVKHQGIYNSRIHANETLNLKTGKIYKLTRHS